MTNLLVEFQRAGPFLMPRLLYPVTGVQDGHSHGDTHGGQDESRRHQQETVVQLLSDNKPPISSHRLDPRVFPQRLVASAVKTLTASWASFKIKAQARCFRWVQRLNLPPANTKIQKLGTQNVSFFYSVYKCVCVLLYSYFKYMVALRVKTQQLLIKDKTLNIKQLGTMLKQRWRTPTLATTQQTFLSINWFYRGNFVVFYCVLWSYVAIHDM